MIVKPGLGGSGKRSESITLQLDDPSPITQEPNMQQAIDTVVAEFLADSGWTSANRVNAVSILNRWSRWLGERQIAILDAGKLDVVAWLDERRAAGLAPATLRADFRMFKAFYKWAVTPVDEGGGGELERNPMRGVKAPSVPALPSTKAAAPDDVRQLERCFPNDELGRRNAAMVSLMFRSGLRVGELPHLDLADYVARPDGYRVLHVRITKSDRPRLVPVHPETVRYIDRYMRRRGPLPGPLFRGAANRTNDVNGRLKARAIQDVIERATDRIGIELAPHQLRRGFTSQYLRQGGDVISLEIIGGWSDSRMPRRYLGAEEADAAIDRFFDVVDEHSSRPRHLRAVD